MAHQTEGPDLVAQLDQIITNNENVATLMTEYYKALKKSGTPAPIARQMTLDYHNAFWEKIYYPENGNFHV